MSSSGEESEQEQYSDSEILTESEPDEPEDRSFGEQFAALLNAEVPAKKADNPILSLSKIPGRLEKKREEENKKEREASRLAQTKKQMLNSRRRPIEEFDAANEKAIRKRATRGVIALLNSMTKVAYNPEIIEPVKQEEAPQKQEELLELIMQAAAKSTK